MDKKDDDGTPSRGEQVASISGSTFAYSHTFFAYGAFVLSLIVGCYTHYYKIVQNQYFGYPDEWIPSISATTGDRYPARSVFQILIALAGGPHFLLIFLNYVLTLHRNPTSWKPGVALVTGLMRTFACGGWVYVTSTDSHDVHDVAMLLYLLLTFPYMFASIGAFGGAAEDPRSRSANRVRKILLALFTLTIFPGVYFYLRHKRDRIAGAYSVYAVLEWSQVLYDVAFDACSLVELSYLQLKILDVGEDGRRFPLWCVSAGSDAYSVIWEEKEQAV